MDRLYVRANLRKELTNLFLDYTPAWEGVSYGFNFIEISKENPTKLSGMANNLKLESWPSNHDRNTKGTFLKPGKFLRAIYPGISKDELSTMGADLALHLSGNDPQFKALKISTTPSEIYNMSHYDSGDIGCSCMRGMGNHIFDLYDVSPVTRILYLTNSDDYLIARALLHDETTILEGYMEGDVIKFMDRIYTTNSNLQAVFYKWAIRNGYYRKQYQSCSELAEVVTPGGDHIDLKISIPVFQEKFRKLPYMDTFRYYNDGTLFNTSSHDYIDILECTGGGTDYGKLLAYRICNCSLCGTGIYDIDAQYKGTRYVICASCEEKSTLCEGCGEYRYGDFIDVTVEGENQSLCISCHNNLSTCTECGVLGHSSVSGSSVGGRWFCNEHVDLIKDCALHHIRYVTRCSVCVREADRKEALELAMIALTESLAPMRVKNSNSFQIIYGNRLFMLEYPRFTIKIYEVPLNTSCRTIGNLDPEEYDLDDISRVVLELLQNMGTDDFIVLNPGWIAVDSWRDTTTTSTNVNTSDQVWFSLTSTGS